MHTYNISLALGWKRRGLYTTLESPMAQNTVPEWKQKRKLRSNRLYCYGLLLAKSESMIHFKVLSLGQIYVVVWARYRKGNHISLLVLSFVFLMVVNSSVNLSTCTNGFVELNAFKPLKTIILCKERHLQSACTADHCFDDVENQWDSYTPSWESTQINECF